MKPVIGISCSFDNQEKWSYLRHTYVDSVVRAGGTPLILPSLDEEELIGDYIRLCDGFLLSGGGDLDPVYWGAEPHPRLGEVDPVRDAFEMNLTRRTLIEDKPALFICRGIQVLNVAAGGSLIQNIKSDIMHRQKAPRYHPCHDISISNGSLLHSICEQETARVNSFHHQAIGDLGHGLVVTAQARDGIIEAVEIPGHKFLVGVQWHPEAMRDDLSSRLFQRLVKNSTK